VCACSGRALFAAMAENKENVNNGDERYANFSDNTMKDRLAARAAFLAASRPKNKGSSKADKIRSASKSTYGLEPSGRCEGWDKYYFFSVPGAKVATSGPVSKDAKDKKPVADIPLKLSTANMGRNRPAVHGPQTFSSSAFSKEIIMRERGRIEKKGGGSMRSDYSDNFGNLPRSTTCELGLPNYEGQRFEKNASNTISPGMINRSASDSLLQGPPPEMTLSQGTQPRKRMGPYWPPKTEQRPDSMTTREALFPGGHRTFVDLNCMDRAAPRGVGYCVFAG